MCVRGAIRKSIEVLLLAREYIQQHISIQYIIRVYFIIAQICVSSFSVRERRLQAACVCIKLFYFFLLCAYYYREERLLIRSSILHMCAAVVAIILIKICLIFTYKWTYIHTCLRIHNTYVCKVMYVHKYMNTRRGVIISC